jgi:hypothetical protein
MGICETMRKAKSEPPSVVHRTISRRTFCETGMAVLSAQLVPGMAFGFAADTAAAASGASGLPTLDELGTGWLDCGQLAQMPSLHNFHDIPAWRTTLWRRLWTALAHLLFAAALWHDN